MELNINFNKKIKPAIESSEALTDWFERNQDWMAYFEFTHPACTHFEGNRMAHIDVKVLGRMSSEGLFWLESEGLPKKEKAAKAIMAMDKVYEEALPYISDVAIKKYYIDTNELDKKTSKVRR